MTLEFLGGRFGRPAVMLGDGGVRANGTDTGTGYAGTGG